MTPRVFISYRSSDGVDKATALARELNALFGAEQVFLDKEDLPAGAPWREAVAGTLDARPVLLVLVTPDTFGATAADGTRRIDDPHDPVRREIEAALAAGAHVVPLLGDGVERLPERHALPPSLASLNERTWRRLRAYDWPDDLERLVADLVALGVAPAAAAQDRRASDRRRWLALGGAFSAGAALMGALWLASLFVPRAADPMTQFSGAWRADVAPPTGEAGSRFDRLQLHLVHQGEEVKLVSEPIDITQDPSWSAFAAQWHERFGEKLERVVMRGAGAARLDPGAPAAIDIGVRLETPAGGSPIETGNLSAQAAADGERAQGRLWMNGEQAERALTLTRVR